MTGANH